MGTTKVNGRKTNGVVPVKNGKVNAKDTDTQSGKVKAGDVFDPMAVRWMERFEKPMDNLWSKVPGILKPVIVTIAVFSLGVAVRGK